MKKAGKEKNVIIRSVVIAALVVAVLVCIVLMLYKTIYEERMKKWAKVQQT